MSHLLRFENVSCTRGGRLLFQQLSFAMAAGDGLHVVGPNGSGKSSLIRVAAGLLRPDSGLVEAASAALADDALALDRELPLERALRFWIGGSSGPALEALGVDELAKVPVRHLSAGQRKRATIARVLGSGAPLWLLDEPFNGLDQASARRVEQLIADHRAAGGAVVVASHLALPGAWTTLELAA